MINLTDAFNSIIKAFQNPIYGQNGSATLTILSEVEGQARERLKQIKMLTKAAVA